jgi:hypothetical protein
MDKRDLSVITIVVVVAIVAILFVWIDPIPATEEQCNRLDGGHDHIQKWCDCKKVWVGEPLNKSSTECHARVVP